MNNLKKMLVAGSIAAGLAVAGQGTVLAGMKIHLHPDESLGGAWPNQPAVVIGSPDIVDVAQSAGSFSTLIAAVQAAGLVDTLKGDGPFTVFAPTDEAFAQIPQDQLNALLADKAALTKVLTYHVLPGRVEAADVAGMTSARTVQGQSVRIDTSSGVRVDEANVVKADIMASNGVIHVIDRVILPN